MTVSEGSTVVVNELSTFSSVWRKDTFLLHSSTARSVLLVLEKLNVINLIRYFREWDGKVLSHSCPNESNQSINQSINRSINQSISQAINQSINLGIFPDDWKCVRATPFFKQGDRDDLNSYRPISVISVVAKAMKELSMINYMPI